MSEQRASLRIVDGGAPSTASRARGIAVTGGKGGVGKSTVAVNLAAAYAATRARTLVVDAGFGMADLNLLLGVAPTRSLLDALAGTPIEDVLVRAHGLALLPALNGSAALANLSAAARAHVLAMVRSLLEQFDAIVLDVAAGVGASQTAFAAAAADTLVVVTPEPVAIAAAYGCLKVLAGEHGCEHAYLVPNRITSEAEGREVVARLTELVDRFLDLRVTVLPAIPADPAVSVAAEQGVPLVCHDPTTPAARAFRRLARALDAASAERSRTGRRRGYLTAAPSEGELR